MERLLSQEPGNAVPTLTQGLSVLEIGVRDPFGMEYDALGSAWATACFAARHDHFVRRKGWVAENPSHRGLERDEYDSHCLHLAVFEGTEVLSYLRVLPADRDVGFMLDRDFAPLIAEPLRQALPRDGAVELSRLLCRTAPRRSGAPTGCHPTRNYPAGSHSIEPHPVERLLKRLYHIARERDFNRFYIVVEESWLRPFERRFGLPFRVLGSPHVFPDGTRTVAAVATLEEMETAMKNHSAAKYDWYQSAED